MKLVSKNWISFDLLCFRIHSKHFEYAKFGLSVQGPSVCRFELTDSIENHVVYDGQQTPIFLASDFDSIQSEENIKIFDIFSRF